MAFFPCREADARLGHHTQTVLASSEWGTRQVAQALSHWVSCPLLFLRIGLHCPQQPGMGNGVKEGVVRLREDADTVLPSSVPSKASTWPQCSHGSLSCGCVPITDHPYTHWCGAASV